MELGADPERRQELFDFQNGRQSPSGLVLLQQSLQNNNDDQRGHRSQRKQNQKMIDEGYITNDNYIYAAYHCIAMLCRSRYCSNQKIQCFSQGMELHHRK